MGFPWNEIEKWPHSSLSVHGSNESTLASAPHKSHPFKRSDKKVLPVAVFLVPDWGMKPATASGCRTSPPSYIAWLASTTKRRHGRLHSQSGTKNCASGVLQDIKASLNSNPAPCSIAALKQVIYFLCANKNFSSVFRDILKVSCYS